MLKLILLDLDGTLLDTEKASIAMYQRALAENGYKKPGAKKIKSLFGNTAKHILEHLAPGAGRRMHALLESSARISLEVIPLMRRNGLSRAVPRLARRCMLGVVTNRRLRSTVAILRHFRLSRYFRAVISAKRGSLAHKPDRKPPYYYAEAEPKPSGAGILLAMRRLGVRRKETLFIGDHECDEGAGRAADVRTLIIRPGKGPESVLGEIDSLLSWNVQKK